MRSARSLKKLFNLFFSVYFDISQRLVSVAVRTCSAPQGESGAELLELHQRIKVGRNDFSLRVWFALIADASRLN